MLERINGALGGRLLPLLLLAAGLFFTVYLRGFWLLHPIKTWRLLRSGEGSPLRALSMALAGTLGVGNITGVALAIALGGAGSVLWMWVSALAAMALKYAEVYLAMHYRGVGTGGAMYYIRHGLGGVGGRILGGVYAVLCLGVALTMGSMVQSGSAAVGLAETFHLPPWVCGIAMAALTAWVVLGGAEGISTVTSRLIPLLTLVYVGVSLWVILPSVGRLPGLLCRILREALSPAAVGGGALGTAVRYGVARGVLSNEAGCGTSAMAHATSGTDPHRQGVCGILEVFVDTVLLCSLTAFVILLAFEEVPALDGMVLAGLAYGRVLGEGAACFVAVAVALFAFATALCWAYYGRVCLSYLTRRAWVQKAFLCLFCLLMAVGAVFTPARVFGLADLFLALLCCCNIPVLLLLRKKIASPALGAELAWDGVKGPHRKDGGGDRRPPQRECPLP